MRSFIACASSVLFALAALPAVLAAPATSSPFKLTGCQAPLPTVPANQTQLVLTAGMTTEFAMFGIGTQNYTCGADGKYASFGAEATLFDVSCFLNKPGFNTIAKMVEGFAANSPTFTGTFNRVCGGAPSQGGQHFFRTNPAAAGIQPVFIVKGQTFIGAKKGATPNPPAVDLLQLSKVEGTMASSNVFRMQTTGGVAPASCTPGSANKKVPYTAVYFFVKG